jgi:hypothetical protein
MQQLYFVISSVRDAGFFLLAAVAVYSFFRLAFEYRSDLRVLVFCMWAKENLTPKGIAFRNRIFRFLGYSAVWWLGWSIPLVALFLLFPEVR